MAHTTVQEVLKAVTDASFPAGKEELMKAAQEAHAPPQVMDALREMPPEQYENKNEVARSVRVDPDSDAPHSDAQRAKQAAQHGKTGMAEQLRDASKPPVQEELDE
ncbi:DUF2795 domain-containing protein [Streptomyces sp. ODS28]|uniref:DUF2795 domain-containing protein n=1 Tax=Streptomyces sp. ODS28 TaxID=3136688 RepID=UPI0031EA0369